MALAQGNLTISLKFQVCKFLQIYSNLVFCLTKTKSHWDPCQCIVWLGTILNTTNCTIALTDKRIDGLLSDLEEVLSKCG